VLGTGSRRDGALKLVTKGAPEVVLEQCVNVDDSVRAVLDALFADGERVIAVASRDRGVVLTVGVKDEVELTLEGFLTFATSPRATPARRSRNSNSSVSM